MVKSLVCKNWDNPGTKNDIVEKLELKTWKMNNDGVKNRDTEFVVYYSVFQFLYDSNKALLNTRLQKSTAH